MPLLRVIAGLFALIVGAPLLVRSASQPALSPGLSPLVVGLTIVALGRSAASMAVPVGAVVSGTTDLAIGNVIGSNILNVLPIPGLSALITPLVVPIPLIRQEMPMMIGASLLLLLQLLRVHDGQLSWLDAALLLAVALACRPVFLGGHEIARREGAVFITPDVVCGAADAEYAGRLDVVQSGEDVLTGGSPPGYPQRPRRCLTTATSALSDHSDFGAV